MRDVKEIIERRNELRDVVIPKQQKDYSCATYSEADFEKGLLEKYKSELQALDWLLEGHVEGKRYFIVAYYHNGTIGDGTVETLGGTFPSRYILSRRFGHASEHAVISSILEVNEGDYKNWEQ